MAETKKTTEGQVPKPGPRAAPPVSESSTSTREESDTPVKAEPAEKAAPVKRSKKKPAWVERAHKARGVGTVVTRPQSKG